MSDQQIIDAIEAEIKSAQCERRQDNSAIKTLCVVKYIDGLRFAKELIEKRRKESK